MNLQHYDQTFYDAPNDVLLQENDCLSSIIRAIPLKDAICLDFGCGTGYWTSLMAKEGGTVFGIDSQKELFGKLRSSENLKFVLSDTSIIPFVDNYFDVVLVSWVFQEIVQDSLLRAALSEIRRVIKIDGRLIIAENIYPKSRRLVRNTSLGTIFENEGQPDSLRFFPQNSVQTLTAEYNFVLASQSFCGESFFEVFQRI